MDFFKKYSKYLLLVSFAILGVFVVIYAMQKDDRGENNNTTEISNTPTISVTLAVASPTPTPDLHIGEAKSKLTGLWIPEEEANKRPYAVMLNNIKVANPQSGISDASILYEALVEGGITRLMGIFENVDAASETAKRLGSVRSARHYYVSFADEYDAVFVHFGKTTYADKKMKKLGIDHIDGNIGIGTGAFHRDKTIKAPHNAFASFDGLATIMEKAGYRTEYEEGYEAHFRFAEEDFTLPVGEAVNKLTLKFSSYTSPYFIYDVNNGVYERYQFGDAHIDANTKETLTYKNIIVQFVKEWDIDKNGYQTMDIEDATGKGFYITNGTAVSITWSKNEKTRFMRYYDMEGNELTINPGKTYIAVFPNSRTENVVFE